MTRIFISQLMSGKSDKEIQSQRARLIDKINKIYADAYIIDSFFYEDPPVSNHSLYYLGKSILLMSSADICIFSDDWSKGRGCRIEHECAEQYGIPIIYETDL